MTTRSAGRAGHRWRQARTAVLAASDVCHICGRPGATTVDHEPPLIRLRALGLDGNDPQWLRPAHSRCNTAKGARTVAELRSGGLKW